jgi:hypothetical protein
MSYLKITSSEVVLFHSSNIMLFNYVFESHSKQSIYSHTRAFLILYVCYNTEELSFNVLDREFYI